MIYDRTYTEYASYNTVVSLVCEAPTESVAYLLAVLVSPGKHSGACVTHEFLQILTTYPSRLSPGICIHRSVIEIDAVFTQKPPPLLLIV